MFKPPLKPTLMVFTTKFVVSHCEGILGFSVPSIILVKAGLMKITM